MQLANKFKIRCSAIGEIMTNPQGGSPMQKYLNKKAQIEEGRAKYQGMKPELKTAVTLSENINKWAAELIELEAARFNVNLSQTCITHVQKWLKSQPEFYNKRINFTNKYCDKGNICEDASIEFAAEYFGWGLITKSTTPGENEYMTGNCDIELAKSIEDIKNSWSEDTFPLFEKEIPVAGYEWQGQGYLELYNKPEFGLIYTLMDAPDDIVEPEAWKRARSLKLDELPAELFEQVKAEMTYSHLRPELRIKRFTMQRNPELMPAVKARVEECRDYVAELTGTEKRVKEIIETPAEPVTGSTINVVGGLELDWK